ncbi:Hypothetical protein NTJ_13914 [Nesidiocoris tenuis]|uniref:Uncharacterized protein n=1 Tax=Nesidiocoris tenuis TaxID=355587 RepID=A0ABN7B9N3_9HEMI|nr:Hypothetical protein NTJ_13914 [Nesidiocoris tenuis]
MFNPSSILGSPFKTVLYRRLNTVPIQFNVFSTSRRIELNKAHRPQTLQNRRLPAELSSLRPPSPCPVDCGFTGKAATAVRFSRSTDESADRPFIDPFAPRDHTKQFVAPGLRSAVINNSQPSGAISKCSRAVG